MSGKMIITVGIPGSGKSTWANKVKLSDPENTIIVERDASRSSLFGESYHHGNFPKDKEDQVTRVNQELIKKGLREGKTVIVSDTNINPRSVQSLLKTARNYKVDYSFEYFDVDPSVCKSRNVARGAAGGREVPDFVMDRMISQAYGDDGKLKEIKVGSDGRVFMVAQSTRGSRIIDRFNKQAEFNNPFVDNAVVFVDVDGTLANNSGHAHKYLHKPEKKQFDKFFKAIKDAPVNENVRDLANKMRDEEGLSIVVLTGRDDSAAEELVSFVKRSGIKVSKLVAKKEGDYRPDYDFKHEIIENMKNEGLVPVHALDDREGSIKTLEAHGIMVSKVDTPVFTDDMTGDEIFPNPNVNSIYGSGYCIRCGKPLKNGGNIGPKCRLK